ncbi:MAG: SpoVG family protein [Candidatus Omnitrophica bacterium]|nr:SpoVG family protein [Candidatus Omnitrophota bacterium]MDD5236881.1 SpoVG family protein [Candidatus Omnitrophota bacterium]MDD5610922.1 SpoVG family protein [Candidatus Omnitrophota bacterium]
MSKETKIEVNRLHKLDGDSKLKAFVDVSFDGFVVKGLRVVEGKNGLFVGMPQQQGKNGQWYDVSYPLSKQIHQEITEIVLKAYNS